MTALKPTETSRVRGVASERYPLNRKSSHPDSNEPATDAHHIFARSKQVGDSWFVEITVDTDEEARALFGDAFPYKDGVAIIPHVTGLTREQHEAVEQHRAWIKLEGGVFNWYDRVPANDGPAEGGDGWITGDGDWWKLVGPLNPQPGSRESKPKRKRFKGEARKKRKTISIRVPDTAEEDGAALYDEYIEAIRQSERLRAEFGWSETVPPYNPIMAGLALLIQEYGG